VRSGATITRRIRSVYFLTASKVPTLTDPKCSGLQFNRFSVRGLVRRVGRPTVGDEPRKLIAIRLDAKVLGWLRKTAKKKGLPYQSLVNEILAGEMRKAS
jgi:uncharacterized protein (DUF4415 family)